MATKVVFVTSTGAVTVPSDFGTLVSVEVIGAGAGGKPSSGGVGGEGGGGGAYSSSTAVTGITANGTIYVSIGIGGASGVAGGDTWVNAASNAAPTLTTQGALAKGGAVGASGTGGLGGASASGVGTTKQSGGNGGGSVAGAFGGGGGAAGPSGAGAAGGAGNSVNGGGGGGGGSNGGSVGNVGSTTGGDGGNGVGGTGGGLKGNNANGTAGTAGTGAGGGGGQGSTFVGGNGATSAIYTQTSNSATAGPGGGGGGTWYFGTTGGTGGLYGGGGGGAVTGGAGGGGIVVFTYTTAPTTTLATRLTSTGNLFVNGSFDENTSISPAKFRTTANTVYAGTFDEVSDMIVTNGLLLYVNGSSDVYSGSGTQWSDLSPYNNNATLTGSPTYNIGTGGGSFAFDGSTQYAPVTTALLNTTYTGKTVFFVGRLNTSAWTPGLAQYRGMFGSAGAPRNFNFYVYHDAANLIYFHYSTPGSAFITTSVALNTNTWFIAAVTQDSTTSTVYLNGASVYSVAGQTLNQYANGGEEAVAKADNYFYGDVAVCAVYSRALSSAEILNNYNAFAARVGLTPTTTAPVKREGSDGTMYLTGIFDENTGAV